MGDWSKVNWERFRRPLQPALVAEWDEGDEKPSLDTSGLRARLHSAERAADAGVRSAAAGMLTGAARAVEQTAAIPGMLAPDTRQVEPIPEQGAPPGLYSRMAPPTSPRPMLGAQPPQPPRWAQGAAALLDEMSKEVREGTPEIDPRLQDSFLWTKLPGAAASTIPMMGAGAAGALVGIPPPMMAGMVGALTQGGGNFLEAQARLTPKVARGEITPEQAKERAYQAWAVGLGIGSTEAIGVGRILGRMDKLTGGSVSRTLGRTAFGTLLEAGEEATQEAASQGMNNAAMAQLTGDEIALLEGVGEGAGVGAVVGAVLSLAFSGAQRLAGAGTFQAEPEVGGEMGVTPETPGEGTSQAPAPPQNIQGGVLQPDLVPGVGGAPGDAAAEPLVQRFAENLQKVTQAEGQEITPEVAQALVAGARYAVGKVGDLARAFGAKAVLVGEPGRTLPLEGQYDPDTRTLILDASLDEATAGRQVLAHELWGHHGRKIAEQEWTSIRDDLEDSFPELMDAWRVEHAEARARAGIGKPDADLLREESVAHAAEEAAGFTIWALGNRERLETLLTQARRRDGGRTFVQVLMDLLRQAGRAIGLGQGTAQQQLELLAREVSAGQWESMNPRHAAELADRFVRLADAMVAGAMQARGSGEYTASTGVNPASSRAVGAEQAQAPVLPGASSTPLGTEAEAGAGLGVPAGQEPASPPGPALSFAGALAEDIQAGRAEDEAAISAMEREAGEIGGEADVAGEGPGTPPDAGGGIRMPTEPGLFGPVEREAHSPAAAQSAQVSQLNLLDVQEGDLPGQTSLLDEPRQPTGPTPESVTKAAQAMRSRRFDRSTKLLEAVRKELKLKPEDDVRLEQATAAQLRKAWRAAGQSPAKLSAKELRTKTAEALQSGYRDAGEALAAPAETPERKQQKSAERSKAASEKVLARRRRIAAGLEGSFQDFVRAMGGIANPENHFEAYAQKETGKRGVRFGLGPISYPKGSDKGVPYEHIAEAAVEVGYFPGRGMGDIGLQEILDALESNPPAPALQLEGDMAEAQAHYEREQAAEEAYYAALSPEERAQADAFMAERARQAEQEPEFDRFSLPKQTETEAFKRWFGQSKVVDEQGKPLVVYHGSGVPITEFDYRFTDQGNDQLGSGFYFTTDVVQAEGYTKHRIDSDTPKLGGESEPTVVSAYLSIQNPLDSEHIGTLTKQQARKIIKRSPRLSEALQDWGDPDEGEARLIDTAADAYAERGVNVLGQLNKLSNDFYPGEVGRFNAAVRDVLGYDGVVAEYPGRKHFVAWFPTQIKSASQNRGTFDPINPDIRFSLPAYHGTPHEFDEFSTDHIGSGEGAQAYGWGLYFAGKREVADYYRKSIAHPTWMLDGKPLNKGGNLTPLGREHTRLTMSLTDIQAPDTENPKAAVQKEAAELRDHAKFARKVYGDVTASMYEDKAAQLEEYADRLTVKHGTTYHVSLAPDDDEWLLWDEPLSKQSEKVRDGLGRLFGKFGIKPDREWGGHMFPPKPGDPARPWPEVSGGTVYRHLSEWTPIGRTSREASDTLRDFGIRGIKYLDGSSRTRGEGSYNYVVFDASDVEILERFSLPAITPTPGGGSFDQRDESTWQRLVRGFSYEFDPVVRVAPDSEVTTALRIYPGRRSDELGKIAAQQNKLKKLLRRAKIGLDEFDDYLRALHAPRRNDLMAERHPGAFDPLFNPGSGATSKGARLTPWVIQGILDRVRSDPRAAAFEKGAAIVHAVNEAALDLRVASGRLSEEGAATWREQFGPAYVPLRTGEDEGDRPNPFSRGQGLQAPKIESRRAEGRKTASGSPTIWSFAQAEEVVSRATRNEVGQAMGRVVEQNPLPMWREVESIDKDTQAAIADGKAEAFRYKSNGEDRYIVFEGPQGILAARALKRLDVKRLDTVIPFFGKLSRWFMQSFTQRNPEFIVSNLAKDVQTAALRTAATQRLSGGPRVGVVVGKAALGIRRVLKAETDGVEPPSGYWEDRFKQYRRAGGLVGYTQTFDYHEQAKDFANALERGSVADAWATWRQRFYDVQRAAELGTRLAVFDTALAHGMPETEAAIASRDVTVDFDRKGEWSPLINELFWFFNASLQGGRIVARSVADKSGRGALVAGGIMAFAALVDQWNSWIGEEDDRNRWDETPRWSKLAFLQILLPEEVRIPIGNGVTLGLDRLMLPLPWGWNVFYVAGQGGSELARGAIEPGDAAGNLIGSAVDAFNPMGSSPSPAQFFTPSLFEPFVQVSENKKHSGSPIHPPDYGNKADSELYYDDVNRMAKWVTDQLNAAGGGNKREGGEILGKDVSFSPENIEHLVESYSGGTGQFLLRVAKTAKAMLAGDELDTRNVPFVRKFAGEPEDYEMEKQYRRAENRVVKADQVSRLDGGTPQRPELLELVDSLLGTVEKAGGKKRTGGFKKEIEALEEAGKTDEANALRRRFLRLYKETLSR